MAKTGAITLFFRMIAEKTGWNDLTRQVHGALNNMGEMSKAAKAVSMAFGQMGGVVGNVLSNALKGGIWGFAAEGARLAIGKIIEWRETAKKAAAELAADMRNRLADAAKVVAERFERISKALDRSAKFAKEMGARVVAVGDAETAEAASKVRARARGGTDVQKAEAEVAAVRIEAANETRKSAAALTAARDAETRASEKVKAAEDALREATANAVKASNRYLDAAHREVNDEELKKYAESLAKMDEAQKKAEETLVKAKEEETTAANEAVIAYQKNRIARVKASESVAAAEDALAKAKIDAAKAEKKAAEEARKEREAAADALEKANNERLDLEASAANQAMADALYEAAERKEAQRLEIAREVVDIDKQLKVIDKRIAARDKLEERLRKGEEADVRHTNGSFGPFGYGDRSNGEWNGTDDMRRLRATGRADRDAQKAARRDAQNEARWQRIGRQSRQATSAADKDFYEKWGAIRKRQEAAAADERARKDLQAKRDRVIEESRDILKEIRDDLAAANKLG